VIRSASTSFGSFTLSTGRSAGSFFIAFAKRLRLEKGT
jgi:hypothetical protein